MSDADEEKTEFLDALFGRKNSAEVAKAAHPEPDADAESLDKPEVSNSAEAIALSRMVSKYAGRVEDVHPDDPDRVPVFTS